tara:strand:+ start:614 stop:1465 length:852 start_codon:yes stop_codon:yes gene_type:complete
MGISKSESRPSDPNSLNDNLYEQFERPQGNIKNPYNLGAFPNEEINIIKAGLKWEDGNWSSNDRMTLRRKLMYCYVRKQAHWNLAVNYNEYAKYLEIPKIILSSVLSTSLFVNATDNNDFSNTMQFINAGLGTSVAILVGIDSYAKFSETYNRHKNTSLEYSKLSAKIERLLHAKPDERQSFSVVLSKIDEKYEKIREEAAFISQEFIDEFIDLLENDNSCYEYVDSSLKTKIRNNISENDEEPDSLSPLQLKNINDSLSPTNKSVPKQETTSTKSDIENQIT